MISDRTLRVVIIITLIFGVIIILMTTCIFLFKGNISFGSAINSELTSAYGDFIGGLVGTIFTILATLLIWLTYNSQKSELQKTITIAAEQSETSKLQNLTSRKQQFESTFFNMTSTLLNLPDKLSGNLPLITSVGGIQFVDEDTKHRYEGHDFVAVSLRCFKSQFDPDYDWLSLSDLDLISYTASKYDNFYDNYLGIMDHYFRYIYNILKFVDNSSIENKKLYIDLLQAQLSKDELGLLFYNGIGKYGYKKLYALMEKYNFLENLNESAIFSKGMKHARIYKYTTFKFLPETVRLGVVAQAMNDNPDSCPNEKRWDYYINKYNLTDIETDVLYLNFKDSFNEAVLCSIKNKS